MQPAVSITEKKEGLQPAGSIRKTKNEKQTRRKACSPLFLSYIIPKEKDRQEGMRAARGFNRKKKDRYEGGLAARWFSPKRKKIDKKEGLQPAVSISERRRQTRRRLAARWFNPRGKR